MQSTEYQNRYSLSSSKSVRELINQYDWDTDVAYAVMMAESGGDPKEVNLNHGTADYSIGLFQINLYGSLSDGRPPADWLKNPENNVDYAYKIYEDDGWTAWGAYTDGRYLEFLN